MNRLATWAFAALLATGAAWAQREKTVNGMVINLGIISAEQAVIDDAKTHRRIADATVVVAVRSPGGAVEEKPLLHTQAAGLADYSELFVFGSSGTYRLRVKVTPAHSPKSTETVFTVHHEA